MDPEIRKLQDQLDALLARFTDEQAYVVLDRFEVRFGAAAVWWVPDDLSDLLDRPITLAEREAVSSSKEWCDHLRDVMYEAGSLHLSHLIDVLDLPYADDTDDPQPGLTPPVGVASFDQYRSRTGPVEEEQA